MQRLKGNNFSEEKQEFIEEIKKAEKKKRGSKTP